MVCALLAACGGDGGLGPSASLQIDPASLTLPQQQSQQLTVSVLDGTGTLVTGVPVTFASSDTNVVTVSATGLVHSVGQAGQAMVTVKAKGVHTPASIPVTVTATSDHIAVAPSPGAVPQLGTLQLDAKLVDRIGQPIAGATLAFNSSTPAILTVSPTGLVTSVGPAGQATIFVTNGTLTTQTVIAVTQVPTTLRVQPNPIVLGISQHLQLSATVLDAVGTAMPGLPFTYAASPSGILTISGSGELASVGPTGSGTVTVTSGTLHADASVSVVSASHPTNMAISATTPIGDQGYSAVISSAGKVYVAALGGHLAYGQLPSTTLGSLSLGGQTTSLALDPAGSHLWVGGAPGVNAVTDLDVSGDTPVILGSVTDLSGYVFDVRVSGDGQRVFAGTSAGMVYVIDAATRTVANSFDLGSGIVHLVRHPSQPLLYASAPDMGKVVEINLQTSAVRTLSSTGRPQALVLSADGSELYVADENGSINIITVATGTAQSVSLSCGPYGLTRTPDGTQLYATCAIAGSVQVVDLQNRTVVKSIQTTGRPRRPWASPDGLTVVVPNEGGWVDYIR